MINLNCQLDEIQNHLWDNHLSMLAGDYLHHVNLGGRTWHPLWVVSFPEIRSESQTVRRKWAATKCSSPFSSCYQSFVTSLLGLTGLLNCVPKWTVFLYVVLGAALYHSNGKISHDVVFQILDTCPKETPSVCQRKALSSCWLLHSQCDDL